MSCLQDEKPAPAAGFFIGEKGQTDLSFAVFIPPTSPFHVDTNAK
ncbi:hypothetical protein [Serratia marcescens]|nr:hypothetical protein [Serratia marcescens]WGL93223.1 hypothetical protein QFB85_10110 [Serratia marcescens]WHS68601.1 hypothetical protein JS036_12745 [Serratia marcescens]